MSGKSDQLCRFYSRGKKCRFGDTCRYQHLPTELSSDNLPTDKQLDTVLPEDTADFNTLSRKDPDSIVKSTNSNEGLNLLQSGETQASGGRSVSTSNKQKKVCSYFTKHSWCTYGKNCRFLHQKPDQDAVNNYSVEEGDTQREVGTSDTLIDSDQYDSPAIIKSSVHDSTAQVVAKDDRKICTIYARRGYCPYKRQCRFEHVRGRREYTKPPRFETSKKTNDVVAPEPEEDGKEENSRVKQRLCKFFQRGHCKSGERCKFWHPVDMMDDVTFDLERSVSLQEKKTDPEPLDVQKPMVNRPSNQRSYPTRAITRPTNQKISLKRETASQEEVEKLRKTEIDQLQKRFPRDKCKVIRDEEDVFECRVIFSPSDPDWPFEVKKFELLFTIPSTYPKQMLTVTLPLDQDLPETVRRYVELCVADWIIEKGQQLEEAGVYEIVFRPFLRWLDRNLESYVTEGLRQLKREIVAKAAGFEFINAAELQSKYKASEQNEEDKEEEEEEEEEEATGEETPGEDESNESDENSDEHDTDRSSNRDVAIDLETEKKGTEVSLRFLQLKDGAATLLFEKIHIVIQCGRCKNRTDFSTPARRINSVSCSKCNITQLVTFRSALVHQMSSVIGYLDLDNCTVFDIILQESEAKLGCMNCSKESKIDGLVTGQPLNTWCRHCHQKMMIAAESVFFAQLQPATIMTESQKIHQVATKKRVQKDPAIQEGKPLPNYGACKHYKKSYRWFRFPCCGMVYPCDVCHEEKGDGHEMIFANRVVCGFCCKEQPYSPDKPCTMCQQMLTRTKSAHWEGGLGCRNKVKMSKNDSQKYSNMNKTISKHAQKVKDGNSKKKTKLRHA